MRIFFAASVGFAVPVSEMFSIAAFWKGVVLGVGPTIGTKVFSGLFGYVTPTLPRCIVTTHAVAWVGSHFYSHVHTSIHRYVRYHDEQGVTHMYRDGAANPVTPTQDGRHRMRAGCPAAQVP